MGLSVNYVEDTRPIKTAVLSQPKGTLDLTMSKNAKGNRIRISNRDGNVVNVAVTELPGFIDGLNRLVKFGAKVSQRAA